MLELASILCGFALGLAILFNGFIAVKIKKQA
jgi:4-amino-4-deoxy-L-arabinose transferase-like glycosyltransferase